MEKPGCEGIEISFKNDLHGYIARNDSSLNADRERGYLAEL